MTDYEPDEGFAELLATCSDAASKLLDFQTMILEIPSKKTSSLLLERTPVSFIDDQHGLYTK